MKQLYFKHKMMKTIWISCLAVATVMFVSGCGAGGVRTEVLSNGVTYHPLEHYDWCKTYEDRPNAECRVEKDGPIKAYVTPDIQATVVSLINNNSNITDLCNKVDRIKLLPNHDSPNSCKNYVRERLDIDNEGGTTYNNWKKAYEFGFIDKGQWLISNGRAFEAYQEGLIDKDTARTGMLKYGQITEAYEAKLIDKNTADLYLEKQAINNAIRVSQQEQQQRAMKVEADREESQNIQTVTNGLNALSNQLNTMNNQMKQRNNSYQGFDVSKGLNFKTSGSPQNTNYQINSKQTSYQSNSGQKDQYDIHQHDVGRSQTNNQSSGYQGSSGNLYQYDMSKGNDRAAYSVDTAAQQRDNNYNLYDASGRLQQDRNNGLYGAGIYGK